MKDVRVSLAQIAPRLGLVRDNLQTHLELAGRAESEGAGLLVFPELSLCGYVLRDQVPEIALRLDGDPLLRLREASTRLDLVVGFVEESAGHLFYNSCAYLSGGEVVHVHRKVYLPTYGMFDEGRDFASGDAFRAFDTEHGRMGLMICEDAWHATSAWLLAQQKASVLLVPSSGPARGAKPGIGVTSVQVWRDLLRVTAQFQTVHIVYVNRVGCEDGLTFGGGSMVVDPFGRPTVELPDLDSAFRTVELSDEVLRRARTAYPLIRDADIEMVHRELQRLRAERFDLPESEPSPASEEKS